MELTKSSQEEAKKQVAERVAELLNKAYSEPKLLFHTGGTKMFLKEESRVKRYVAIARFFGWRVMLHVLSSVCKRRVRQLVKE